MLDKQVGGGGTATVLGHASDAVGLGWEAGREAAPHRIGWRGSLPCLSWTRGPSPGCIRELQADPSLHTTC